MKIIIIRDSVQKFQQINETIGINSYHNLVTDSIASALIQLGHQVEVCETDITLEYHLRQSKPDFVFNTSIRNLDGSAYAFAPGIFEKLGIPFSGPSAKACSTAYDKYKTIEILKQSGIRAPQAVSFSTKAEINTPPLISFPVFVKPEQGGCSQGISTQSLITERDKFVDKAKACMDAIKAPIIVEEFLPGREFTVGILGNNPPGVLPIIEFEFSDLKLPFRSYSRKMDMVWKEESVCPANINHILKIKIENLAKKAYEAIECRDYARIDIRMDADDNPCILEVNAIPNLEPEMSSYALMAIQAGFSFIELIEKILNISLERSKSLNSANE